jgi:hypothetical protein
MELQVEELAPRRQIVLGAALSINLHEMRSNKIMIIHILHARLVQLIVFEAHNSISHQNALQVDNKALIIQNPFGEVGNVLARIAFS